MFNFKFYIDIGNSKSVRYRKLVHGIHEEKYGINIFRYSRTMTEFAIVLVLGVHYCS